MFKKIENLMKRLVILRLNSGQSLFIDPKTTSAEIPEEELKDNSKVDKLQIENGTDDPDNTVHSKNDSKRKAI